MRKSQLLICVIFILYAVVGGLCATGWLNIGNNVLGALSLTALFFSVSDVFVKVRNVLFEKNVLQNVVGIAVLFLNEKMKEVGTHHNINIRNTIENLEDTVGYKCDRKMIHPNEYAKLRFIRGLLLASDILFVLGVAIFIIMPFIKDNLLPQGFTSVVSLFAFSAMMCCMFLDEMAMDISQRNNEIMNEKYAIICGQFQDFRTFNEMYFHYYKDYLIMYGDKLNG
ncbi:hypothetical protein [Butyrivibrio sp. XPD2006]|uniref:hypothetical protein n=1 Tax=Butyrivibrio sp. XPD2006 TaxID=1280668 RepID=UPI0003B6382A|nr:hypothetical protein [Butyrivibrio sp. XPD2006]